MVGTAPVPHCMDAASRISPILPDCSEEPDGGGVKVFQRLPSQLGMLLNERIVVKYYTGNMVVASTIIPVQPLTYQDVYICNGR